MPRTNKFPAPAKEPKVVTGLWLGEQLYRCLTAAEALPILVSSDGHLLPSAKKLKPWQDELLRRASGYAKRLKKLKEAKRG